MSWLILQLFNICLLRAAPQDLPASRVLPVLLSGCYLLVSFLVALRSNGSLIAMQVALVDLGLLLALVFSLLYLLNKAARIGQTLSALAGSGSLLGLVALPLVLSVSPGQASDQLPAMLTLLWLLLLLWNLVVMAHIMRHALSTSLAIGMAVAVLYALVTMQVILALFPAQAT